MARPLQSNIPARPTISHLNSSATRVTGSLSLKSRRSAHRLGREPHAS
jgi:hypothetical protein